MMSPAPEIVGNPMFLLIERLAYLLIGIFFVVAFYRGIKRNIKEK